MTKLSICFCMIQCVAKIPEELRDPERLLRPHIKHVFCFVILLHASFIWTGKIFHSDQKASPTNYYWTLRENLRPFISQLFLFFMHLPLCSAPTPNPHLLVSPHLLNSPHVPQSVRLCSKCILIPMNVWSPPSRCLLMPLIALNINPLLIAQQQFEHKGEE